MTTSIQQLVEEMAARARRASRSMAVLSTDRKNAILARMAAMLEENKAEIQAENARDLEAARQKGLSSAMIDRLTLSDKVIGSMVTGLAEVAALPDPVGEISQMAKRPSGIMVGRMRVPLGVIAMIYESRPNVTVDAAALCLKAGNAVVLRGGSEAIHSNLVLAKILRQAMEAEGGDPDAIGVISVTDRQAVNVLLQQEETIDLVIPRGGEGLIRFVAENSRIPVLKHYKGVCHIFVDADADLETATSIVLNAKTQRPGVCNALETLLVHADVAEAFLPLVIGRLRDAGVEVRGCDTTARFVADVVPATEEDWGCEYLDLILAVRVVDDLNGAMDHIARYGSQHTESIITTNYGNAMRFLREVDASSVMVNASTRFSDGGQYGLGAGIGLSTTKLHAYGPMGLEELTTRKFIVFGEGQVRA